jgi:hypothetical protein
MVTMVRSCVMSSSLHQFRCMHDYQHTDSYRSRERERWYSMTINFPEQKIWHHACLLKPLPQARKKDQDVIVHSQETRSGMSYVNRAGQPLGCPYTRSGGRRVGVAFRLPCAALSFPKRSGDSALVRPVLSLIGPLVQRVRQPCSSREVV